MNKIANAILVIAVVVMIPTFTSAEPKEKDPDYPKIKAELVPPILAMKSGTFEGKVRMPWRLYVPKEASAANKLPLVVALHGAGRRGTDNVGPMSLFNSFYSVEEQKKHPSYILAPQIREGHSWVHNKGGLKNIEVDQTPPTDEMLTLFDLVAQTLKDYPIDVDRVYVVGQSLGGFGTWDAITRRPDIWAAAVPIAGGGDPSKVALFKNIPIWAWHGSKDTTVPVENTRAIIEALKKAGASPKYDEPPVGHSSWNNAFADPELYDWLFAQKRQHPSS